MVVSARRKGTSFAKFEQLFPTSESCIEHILKCRLKTQNCPKCNRPAIFVKIKSANRYIPKCCYDQAIYPLRGTIFAGTRIPLDTWFRTILYFTNTSSGISPDFVHRQFGISQKASVRMCQRIREHLTALDRRIILGQDGSAVYVSETTVRSVARKNQKNGVRFRVLLATDCSETVVMPVTTGKHTKSRDLLLDRISRKSAIITQTPALRKKLLNYKKFSRVRGMPIETATDPYLEPFCRLSVLGIALKRFILPSHYWVSERHIASYIGHFAFLYRRRSRGTETFLEAVSNFPAIEHLG